MPFDPGAVGTQLVTVGQNEQSIGDKVIRASARIEQLSASFKPDGQFSNSLAEIRSGVATIAGYLGPVASALTFIVNGLNGISIPVVRFTTSNIPGIVGNVTFVTGITVDSTKPFSSIAARVNTVLANVNATIKTLNDIAAGIQNFRNEFPDIQAQLAETSRDLQQGGTEMTGAGVAMEKAGHLLGG